MERLQDSVTTRRRKMAGHILRLQSNVLGARRRQIKEEEVEEDMAKYFQRRLERDECQLAWIPQDRQ